jgi:hypothetical protein
MTSPKDPIAVCTSGYFWDRGYQYMCVRDDAGLLTSVVLGVC